MPLGKDHGAGPGEPSIGERRLRDVMARCRLQCSALFHVTKYTQFVCRDRTASGLSAVICRQCISSGTSAVVVDRGRSSCPLLGPASTLSPGLMLTHPSTPSKCQARPRFHRGLTRSSRPLSHASCGVAAKDCCPGTCQEAPASHHIAPHLQARQRTSYPGDTRRRQKCARPCGDRQVEPGPAPPLRPDADGEAGAPDAPAAGSSHIPTTLSCAQK